MDIIEPFAGEQALGRFLRTYVDIYDPWFGKTIETEYGIEGSGFVDLAWHSVEHQMFIASKSRDEHACPKIDDDEFRYKSAGVIELLCDLFRV